MKRQTYCAVERPEQQIKGFFEETGASATSAPVISSSSFALKDSKSPTVFVGIVPTASEEDDVKDPFDVLTVHKDGRVRRLAADLETQRWSIHHSEMSKLSSSHEVHTAFLVEFEDAKKSLFKRRQDLVALASGDISSAGLEEPSVLLLVLHPVGSEQFSLKDVKIQIFSVSAVTRPHGFGLDESQRLRHLMTVDLPPLDGQGDLEGRALQWNFHSGSAGLNLSFERGFVNIDLSQYSPSVTSQFILEDERFSSIIRISPHSVIGAGKSMVALYDTQYQSIQRSIGIKNILSDSSSKADNSKAPIIFVSYFAKLGIAVATKGSALVAFDLSSLHTTSGSSLKRSRDGLLIDAIGRGIGSSAAQWDTTAKKHKNEHMASLGLTSKEDVEKWNNFTKELDASSRSKDANAFDNAVKSYFGSGESKTLPPPGQFVNSEKILFILSKIFSVKDGESKAPKEISALPSPKLTILFWPDETCRWLIETGYLSMNNVEIAVRRSVKPRILPPFPSASFVQALVDFDPSLSHLILLLKGRVILNSDQLAFALKVFLDVARSRSAALDEPAKAITDGSRTDDNKDRMQEDLEARAVQSRSSQAPEALLADAFTGLNLTLTKLHSHPLPAVVKSFRSTLSNTETLSVIHHLRLSLVTGGHTSPFTEDPPVPVASYQTSPPLSLNTIVDLLTACVDAIGPSGWISAAGFAGTAANELDVIADMKAEVSAALAGVEEATYLKGILREFIRYAGSVVSSAKADRDESARAAATAAAAAARVKHEKLNGADLIVFTPADSSDGDPTGKMLPLSLKATSGAPGTGGEVSKTKVKKSTGEVKKRSSREIGYLRRKQVGKYSFERLIV